jgi:hypothetical protein
MAGQKLIMLCEGRTMLGKACELWLQTPSVFNFKFMKTTTLWSVIGSGLIFLLTQFNASAADHPYYLQALSDLRAARWMIEHRPGDWQRTDDETAAVNRIDKAINEIKKASIDDGKDLNDHPKVDEFPDRIGRLHEAVDFLKAARKDVNQEENNAFADGLRDRAQKLISEAIKRTENAIHS